MTVLVVANLIISAVVLVLMGVFTWGLLKVVTSFKQPLTPWVPKPAEKPAQAPERPRLIKGGADE